MSLAAVVAAALCALPLARDLARNPRNARLRAQAPGRFASLTHGRTHFDWLGPEAGPVAVCVHGLTTPSVVWLPLARHLVAMGFRVLVYDLWGRGSSDAPRGLQTPGMFARQLDELLASEGVSGPITLLGYSMGGAIAAHWAAANPDRVERLVLLAPAGMGHDLGRLATWSGDWPLLGDWAFHMAWPRRHAQGIAREGTAFPDSHEIHDHQRSELRRRGFLRSVLSSIRGTLRRSSETAQRSLARDEVPVLAIWGEADAVIPLSAMGRLTQWNRAARHVVIDGAGHGLPYTHAEAVAEAIRA